MKNEIIIKGPNGISDFKLFFLLNINNGITYIAPTQNAPMANNKFCIGFSKRSDNNKINFQSAKPIAFPLETNQMAKKGKANKIDLQISVKKFEKSKLNAWKSKTI